MDTENRWSTIIMAGKERWSSWSTSQRGTAIVVSAGMLLLVLWLVAGWFSGKDLVLNVTLPLRHGATEIDVGSQLRVQDKVWGEVVSRSTPGGTIYKVRLKLNASGRRNLRHADMLYVHDDRHHLGVYSGDPSSRLLQADEPVRAFESYDEAKQQALRNIAR